MLLNHAGTHTSETNPEDGPNPVFPAASGLIYAFIPPRGPCGLPTFALQRFFCFPLLSLTGLEQRSAGIGKPGKKQRIMTTKYFDMLMEDVRLREGLTSCMNCGVCTGVCPAAEFYNYDPRQIVSIVQTRDDEAIEELLKSDTIWYCGECMSCRPRCPRGNTPGYVIQALRTLSQKLGFFVESEKGRQQLALKRIIGENILRTGYCIVPRLVKPDLHPEQGTVWQWIYDNDREIYGQFTPVYMRHGAGALRRLDEESLAEINRIFEVSGGSEMFDTIERHSDRKARELGYEEGADQQYMMDVFLNNNNEHY